MNNRDKHILHFLLLNNRDSTKQALRFENNNLRRTNKMLNEMKPPLGLNEIKPAKCGTVKTHNFRTVFNVLLLMALLIALNSSSFAGDKIKINLHLPPPNKMSAGDLRKLDVTNSINKY
jgi:hypothetical protein